MQITGTIIHVGQAYEIGNKGFVKKEIVVKTDGDFPQEIKIEFLGDKIGALDHYKVNDHVDVAINIRGNRSDDQQGNPRWFNSINGWKINKT